MRLKEDSSSWRSSGIVKRDFKHGNVPVPERNRTTGRKDTRRWCRGKQGVEHDWHRKQQERYSWELDDWIPSYISIYCESCHKHAFRRVSKTSQYPLHINVESEWEYFPIPVQVNGVSHLNNQLDF
jgi:hypothetical protein